MPKITYISGFRQYDSDAKNLYRKSFKYTTTANTTTNNDEKFTENIYIYGGIYELIGNANNGDKLDIKVIDKDNVLGYGAGTVLAHFVEQEYINTEVKCNHICSKDGDLIPAGVYLRAVYTNTGSNTPDLIIRYMMRRG